MSEARRNKVKASIAAIREMYKQGKPLRSDSRKNGQRREVQCRRRGRTPGPRCGRSSEGARFYKAYTKVELRELCEFIESEQAGQEETKCVVGPTPDHQIAIRAPGTAAEYLKLATTNGWSQRDLEEAIRTAFGARRQVGAGHGSRMTCSHSWPIPNASANPGGAGVKNWMWRRAKRQDMSHLIAYLSLSVHESKPPALW